LQNLISSRQNSTEVQARIQSCFSSRTMEI
jgi:hypothetical protein